MIVLNGLGNRSWSFDQSGAYVSKSDYAPTATDTLSDADLLRMRCLLESPQVRAALASSGCTSEAAPKTADGHEGLYVSAGGDYELWPNCGPPGCDLIEVLREAISEVHPKGDGGS